ncbi:hypothetical protein [Methylobacterium aquaticum]|uniref:Retron-type reverse transcriptase n=1 Tax=Methylobacterium aquaticum TaxID=270351 RepID=A0A0J6S981_9HYPH|nr:hypothetical protein [Methylobacterium aquaticum]KMO30207.1 hypothetical protein VP06_22475 [Methylobacterium aquaticum]
MGPHDLVDRLEAEARITVDDDARDLKTNLQDLCARVHTGRDRLDPVRRVFIPKADGGRRPLGVPALEDKIVQGRHAEVLSAADEADCLGGSNGFRPGRNPHQALPSLHTAIMSKRLRHWLMVAGSRAGSAVMALLEAPSSASSRMRAPVPKRCAVLRRPGHCSRASRSAGLSVTAGRGRRRGACQGR